MVTFRRVFRIFLRVSCHVLGEQCEGCEWFLGEEAFSWLLSFCQTVLTACWTSCCLLCCCFYRGWSCRSSPLVVLEIHHQSDHDLEKFSPRRVKTMKKSSSFNPSNFSTAPTETAATLWINCVYKKSLKVTSGKEKRHWACAELVIQEFENFHCLCYVTTEPTLK